jgi:hypothetical protein
MNASDFSRAAGATLILGFIGCAEMPLGPPPPDEVDVVVEVVATVRCGLNLPAANNACFGVGRTDGVTCGRNGDTVRWRPKDPDTTIRSITFPAGNAVVCDGGVRADRRDLVCLLKEQPGLTAGQGIAFKYAIGVTIRGINCDEQDPYLIVTKR